MYRRTIVSLALTCCVATATACHHDSGSTLPSPALRDMDLPSMTTASGIDDQDPDTVLRWVAEHIYTWYPTDIAPGDGFGRACPLLDPGYRADVGVSADGLSGTTDAAWQRWKDLEATVTATAAVASDDHPIDTPTMHRRVVALTQHVTAPNGTTEPDRHLTLYMAETRAKETAGWRISMIASR